MSFLFGCDDVLNSTSTVLLHSCHLMGLFMRLHLGVALPATLRLSCLRIVVNFLYEELSQLQHTILKC